MEKAKVCTCIYNGKLHNESLIKLKILSSIPKSTIMQVNEIDEDLQHNNLLLFLSSSMIITTLDQPLCNFSFSLLFY